PGGPPLRGQGDDVPDLDAVPGGDVIGDRHRAGTEPVEGAGGDLKMDRVPERGLGEGAEVDVPAVELALLLPDLDHGADLRAGAQVICDGARHRPGLGV